MKIFIVTANNERWSERCYADFMGVVNRCQNHTHQCVASAEEADIILFIDLMQLLDDWRMDRLRRHPLVRRFPNKVFVYDECDLPRDFLPGVFTSMPRSRFDKLRHRTISYRILSTEFTVVETEIKEEPSLLFSFQGRRVESARTAVLELKHPRGHIEDTSHINFFGKLAEDVAKEAKANYRRTILNSKFVLCPRGAGVSSFRFYETLGAGRVPVVISDEFVFPEGIDWESCSLQVAEKDIAEIPRILERAEADFAPMAAAARRVYEEWFAPEIWFHRIVEYCLDLQQNGDIGPKKRYFMDARVLREGLRLELRQAKAKFTGSKN